MHRSTKVIDGFSTCFRQWRAVNTHCRFLHGYGVSVKFVFEGQLDHRNWVVDFGGFKRSKVKIPVDNHSSFAPKEWLKWLLDHTTIIAESDPQLDHFKTMSSLGIIQLRIMPEVGCEKFAEYIGMKIRDWCFKETGGNAKLISCEVREHEKNSAIWIA